MAPNIQQSCPPLRGDYISNLKKSYTWDMCKQTCKKILCFFLGVSWGLWSIDSFRTLFIHLFIFIKALQHKCWRSVGHQVLQPAKDGKLGQYVWKVADRRKNPWQPRTCSHPIYAQTLTGVCQAIRIFSPCLRFVVKQKLLAWYLKFGTYKQHIKQIYIHQILYEFDKFSGCY